MAHSFGTFERTQTLALQGGSIEFYLTSWKTKENAPYLIMTVKDSLLETTTDIALNLKEGRDLFRASGRSLSDMKQVKIDE